MHWPEGNLDSGRDVDTLTAHIDILPTLIDLCGLVGPMDYSFDGRSLTPLLYGTPTLGRTGLLLPTSARSRSYQMAQVFGYDESVASDKWY